MQYDEQQLVQERNRHESWLKQQQGVSGTGIGLDASGQTCIKVFTDHISPDTKNAIVSHLRNLPVEFEETGEFRAF